MLISSQTYPYFLLSTWHPLLSVTGHLKLNLPQIGPVFRPQPGGLLLSLSVSGDGTTSIHIQKPRSHPDASLLYLPSSHPGNLPHSSRNHPFLSICSTTIYWATIYFCLDYHNSFPAGLPHWLYPYPHFLPHPQCILEKSFENSSVPNGSHCVWLAIWGSIWPLFPSPVPPGTSLSSLALLHHSLTHQSLSFHGALVHDVSSAWDFLWLIKFFLVLQRSFPQGSLCWAAYIYVRSLCFVYGLMISTTSLMHL